MNHSRRKDRACAYCGHYLGMRVVLKVLLRPYQWPVECPRCFGEIGYSWNRYFLAVLLTLVLHFLVLPAIGVMTFGPKTPHWFDNCWMVSFFATSSVILVLLTRLEVR